MRRLLLIATASLTCLAQTAGIPLEVPWPALKAPLHCEVFLPRTAGKDVPKGLPVVLLLHGGGGHATDFRALDMVGLATLHRVILVAPEGGATGFLDAATDAGDRPAQALREGLLLALERQFDISRERKDRAILGLSLGGFAALHAASNPFRASPASLPLPGYWPSSA
jgi:enterochelin esterase family protein